MIAIIDADSIVYGSAGAAQKRDPETKELVYEPVQNALSNAKRTMLKTIENTKCDDYVLFLTASKDATCFRTAVYPEYKANRRDLERPKYYYDVREYLEKQWQAEIVSSIEADDAVSVLQYEANNYTFSTPERCQSILCGIDKDLNQVPGLHYNYKTQETYFISPLEGFKNFMKQILAGDRADNIPRIKKGWLQKEAFHAIDMAEDIYQVYSIVHQEFRVIYEENALKELHLRGKLLYLLQYRDDSYESFLTDFYGDIEKV